MGHHLGHGIVWVSYKLDTWNSGIFKRGHDHHMGHGIILAPFKLGTTNSGVVKAELILRFLYIANPQQGDLRLLGPPSDQGTGGGARTRDRRVPADLRADSLATEPPTHHKNNKNSNNNNKQ
ncbi:hypothetical protein PoB_002512500 [Plakobranchus ocellatus]|uniref:Uncharacterized protein n=1 Tax=Plakobranchus ocellatus TaxID=259542 RepID=A0AAV3ZVI2_9GAST|nr:hypothetical protein PoB_002512500 [Plakobranchus ocellatus]